MEEIVTTALEESGSDPVQIALFRPIIGFAPDKGEQPNRVPSKRADQPCRYLGLTIVVGNRFAEKAAETFRLRGFPDDKLFYLPRGVDIDRFRPGTRPQKFIAIFTGALIERKGVHHLLEAWSRLNLKNAELWLVGAVHDEIRPHLTRFAGDSVKVLGFVRDHEKLLQQASVYVFPSQWEGSAKTVYEAAACGLPAITTREAGDVVRDGIEGIIVSPGDVNAIAAALKQLHDRPDVVEQMSKAARQRVVENFTWDHYRQRLLVAYETAMKRAR